MVSIWVTEVLLSSLSDSSPQISSRITELLESQEEAVAEAWGGEGEPARILATWPGDGVRARRGVHVYSPSGPGADTQLLHLCDLSH